MMTSEERVASWLRSLEERHLAELTLPETARALRALSSCYVERRAKLVQGGALNSAGKRAAFALFYAPLHFLVTREIVRALGGPQRITHLLDLGCGTGAAGAAWALECGNAAIHGVDRHPWAVAEANWTYRALTLGGHASQGAVETVTMRGGAAQAIVAAYTVNELPDTTRDALLARLLDAHSRGARVLIVEPIAKRMAGWWSQWERAFRAPGGRADEWRFALPLPDRQRQLGRAAGLDPRELTARSLFL